MAYNKLQLQKCKPWKIGHALEINNKSKSDNDLSGIQCDVLSIPLSAILRKYALPEAKNANLCKQPVIDRPKVTKDHEKKTSPLFQINMVTIELASCRQNGKRW